MVPRAFESEWAIPFPMKLVAVAQGPTHASGPWIVQLTLTVVLARATPWPTLRLSATHTASVAAKMDRFRFSLVSLVVTPASFLAAFQSIRPASSVADPSTPPRPGCLADCDSAGTRRAL